MDDGRAAAVAGVMFYLQQEAAELEAALLSSGSHHLRNGWSAYGRKAVADGRKTVQGRRLRRLAGTTMGRGFRSRRS